MINLEGMRVDDRLEILIGALNGMLPDEHGIIRLSAEARNEIVRELSTIHLGTRTLINQRDASRRDTTQEAGPATR